MYCSINACMYFFLDLELPGPGSNPIITGGEVVGGLEKSGRQFYKPGDLVTAFLSFHSSFVHLKDCIGRML